mmetsp:Transcript_8420/g.24145  ORF Transcript_8420/g.24145 Transcript_8420/m.24145 type:complete len:209 (+) Transcript_8420:469-1095(+)
MMTSTDPLPISEWSPLSNDMKDLRTRLTRVTRCLPASSLYQVSFSLSGFGCWPRISAASADSGKLAAACTISLRRSARCRIFNGSLEPLRTASACFFFTFFRASSYFVGSFWQYHGCLFTSSIDIRFPSSYSKSRLIRSWQSSEMRSHTTAMCRDFHHTSLSCCPQTCWSWRSKPGFSASTSTSKGKNPNSITNSTTPLDQISECAAL